MNRFLTLLILTCCVSCNNGTGNKQVTVQNDTVRIHDTLYRNPNKDDWQQGFGLTHDPEQDSIWHKPVSYYISDKNCSGLAFDFYNSLLDPSDNGTTTELLKLAITDNDKLRPFYRWCLSKTLQVSDGALGELVGVPARQYAEKFPDEFFEYLDRSDDGTKYNVWTEAISYSGFYDYTDYSNAEINRKRLERKMLGNLKVKNQENSTRVKKFAFDCTGDKKK